MSEAYEDYADYRSQKAVEGTEYEDFVFDLLREKGLTVLRYVSQKWQYDTGECSGGIEVKYDSLIAEYGNVYIEIAEKARPDAERDYAPSGIYRDDNSWLYVIGDYDQVFVFAKSMLKLLHKSGRYLNKIKPTSKGFVMPEKQALRFAAKVFIRGRDYE